VDDVFGAGNEAVRGFWLIYLKLSTLKSTASSIAHVAS
jgi:hypothetical protein